MKYKKHIEALRREMELDIRFNEYGFQEVQGISCPNPNNKDWLNNQYKILMNELFDFLNTEPRIEIVEEFVIKQIANVKRESFIENEYHQLMLCYTGNLYFILNLKEARLYYEKNKNKAS